jgi:hypothetical protein
MILRVDSMIQFAASQIMNGVSLPVFMSTQKVIGDFMPDDIFDQLCPKKGDRPHATVSQFGRKP